MPIRHSSEGKSQNPRRVFRIELPARRGYDTRVGLEDTLALPDGTRARDNAELVAMAWRILDQQKP